MSVFGVQKEFLDVNTPKTSISASAVSSPETYLHIFKLQFNRKTAFKYKTV